MEKEYLTPVEIEDRFEKLKEVVINTIEKYNDKIAQLMEKETPTDIDKEIINNYEDIFRNIYISKSLYDLPPDSQTGLELYKIAIENCSKCKIIQQLLSSE